MVCTMLHEQVNASIAYTRCHTGAQAPLHRAWLLLNSVLRSYAQSHRRAGATAPSLAVASRLQATLTRADALTGNYHRAPCANTTAQCLPAPCRTTHPVKLRKHDRGGLGQRDADPRRPDGQDGHADARLLLEPARAACCMP